VRLGFFLLNWSVKEALFVGVKCSMHDLILTSVSVIEADIWIKLMYVYRAWNGNVEKRKCRYQINFTRISIQAYIGLLQCGIHRLLNFVDFIYIYLTNVAASLLTRSNLRHKLGHAYDI